MVSGGSWYASSTADLSLGTDAAVRDIEIEPSGARGEHWMRPFASRWSIAFVLRPWYLTSVSGQAPILTRSEMSREDSSTQPTGGE